MIIETPLRKLLAAALVAAAFTAAPAAADTLLVLEGRTSGFEIGERRQEPLDTRVEIWIGASAISRDDGKRGAVLSGDRLTLVDHVNRAYSVLELPVDLSAMLPPEMRRMIDMWKMDVAVTATDERREIDGWKTRRYDVELTNAIGMAIRNRLWVTRDLDIDYGQFQKLSAGLASLQPGGDAAMKELAQIEGFPVLLETTADMGGTTIESSERLVSVEDREPPAGHYAAPAGYTEREFDPAAMSAPGGS